MAEHRPKALNSSEAATKSWFRAGVGFGLWMSKPRWRGVIGGHRSTAKGMGERAEEEGGLYLGCGPRYSRRKRGLG